MSRIRSVTDFNRRCSHPAVGLSGFYRSRHPTGLHYLPLLLGSDLERDDEKRYCQQQDNDHRQARPSFRCLPDRCPPPCHWNPPHSLRSLRTTTKLQARSSTSTNLFSVESLSSGCSSPSSSKTTSSPPSTDAARAIFGAQDTPPNGPLQS